MRKRMQSACMMLVWCMLSALAAAGSQGPARPVQPIQTNISIASKTTVVLTSATDTGPAVKADPAKPRLVATWVVRSGDTLSAIATALAVPGGWQALYAANRSRIGANPDVIHPGTVLTLPGRQRPARYTVASGDTLSGIAARLAVPGGWQALYTANRQVVGPDPGLIRARTVLVLPYPAARSPGHRPPVPRQVPGQGQGIRRQPAPPAASAGIAASSRPPAPAGGMPWWLRDVLLAAGLVVLLGFLAEPVAVFGRRRRQAARAARAARIVMADHERLVVTYSARDDTVYVLTPQGEDPMAVLRAARLVLPDDTYEELASHLGVPANWPME